MEPRESQIEREQELAGRVATAAPQTSARSPEPQTSARSPDRIDAQKSTLVNEVLGVAGALRAAAKHLHGRDQGAVAQYADGAADLVERGAAALDRRSPTEILSELERICRERPLLVGAGAALIGFLGARFVRSSAVRTDFESYEDPLDALEVAQTEGDM